MILYKRGELRTMNLKKAIIDKVVQPHLNGSYNTVYAQVTQYDSVKNKASIEFQDAKSQGLMAIDNVPVQLGSGGVHSAGPFAGDHVWVTFANNSPLQPKIVALADENYNTSTREKLKHISQGTYVPDNISTRTNYDSNSIIDTTNIQPMTNDWLDYNNTNPSKYISFSTLDPSQQVSNTDSSLGYYNAEEPGITHPLNASTIKIRNNGIIDIFVDGNQGIRIDPSAKTINFIGTSEKHHVSDFSIYADTSIDLSSNKDVSISSSNNVSITTGNIWTLNATGSINITSVADINLSSQNNVTIKGKEIILNGDVKMNRDELMGILNEE